MQASSVVGWRRTIMFYVGATVFSLLYAEFLLLFLDPHVETAVFAVSLTLIMPVANVKILMRNAVRKNRSGGN